MFVVFAFNIEVLLFNSFTIVNDSVIKNYWIRKQNGLFWVLEPPQTFFRVWF